MTPPKNNQSELDRRFERKPNSQRVEEYAKNKKPKHKNPDLRVVKKPRRAITNGTPQAEGMSILVLRMLGTEL